MNKPYEEKKDVATEGVELVGDEIGAMGKLVLLRCDFDPKSPNAALLNDDARHEIVKKNAPSMLLEYCSYNGVKPREKDSAGNDIPHYEIKRVDKDHYILSTFVVPDKAWAIHQIESSKNRIGINRTTEQDLK